MTSDVIVVGAINQDSVVQVERFPEGGETILAQSLCLHAGGKGANQAAAASRGGARVALVGAVGDDAAGRAQRKSLVSAGVDVEHVATVSDTTTGQAFISVTSDGQNSIVVVPGANARVDASTVVRALSRLCTSESVVILQTELASEVIEQAARVAHEFKARVVVNNGPCIKLSEQTLSFADPLVVNETEASQMADSTSCTEPMGLALKLHQLSGAKSVVLTLGRRGSCLHDAQGTAFIPAREVSTVDTTGAGDAYIGSLAGALSRGLSLREACVLASDAGAEAVTYRGARPPV